MFPVSSIADQVIAGEITIVESIGKLDRRTLDHERRMRDLRSEQIDLFREVRDGQRELLEVATEMRREIQSNGRAVEGVEAFFSGKLESIEAALQRLVIICGSNGKDHG